MSRFEGIAPRVLASSASVGAFLGVFLAPNSSRAINIQTLHPGQGGSYEYAEDALLRPSQESFDGPSYQFGLAYHWVNDPLITTSEDRSKKTGTVVDGLHTMEAGASWLVHERAALGTAIAVHQIALPGQGRRFAPGDGRVSGRVRFTPPQSRIAGALFGEISIPSGDSKLYVSDGMSGFALGLAGETDIKVATLAANIGFKWSPGARYQDLDYRKRAIAALAVSAPVAKDWWANLEGAGALVLPPNAYQNPGEVYFGLRNQVTPGLQLGAGLAIGSLSPNSSGDVRFLAGLKLAPEQLSVKN